MAVRKDIIYMERVILKNFNSFKNDEVPLDKGFTVVTGPNGAGKSSVFQAIKFALSSNERDGRSTKWSDFIRVGQDTGSVEIWLKVNTDLYKIRRIIQKDQAPYYQIQEPSDTKFHTTTVTKIQSMVEKFNYNPNNVFAFVSQGNITNLKNMNSEDIARFLELGLGLGNLREQITSKKSEVDRLDQQIRNLESIKSSASYELELLKPQIIRLEEKQVLNTQRSKVEKELAWLNRSKLEAEIIDLRKNINDLDRKKVEIDEKKATIERTITHLDQTLKEINNDIQTKNTELAVNEKINKELEEEIAKWQNGKDSLADNIIRTKNTIKSLKLELDRLTKDKKILGEEVKKYEFELSVVTGQKNEMMKKHAEYEVLRKKYQQSMDTFNEVKQKISNYQNELKTSEVSIKNVDKQVDQQMDDYKELKKQIDSYTWFSKDPTKYTKENLTQQKSKIEEALRRINETMKNAEDEIRNDEKEMERLKTSVLDKELPKSREMLQLMKDIEQRHLDVIGPLIDVINFDPQIGPAVDAILNKYVLNSFIAKNKDDFMLLDELIKKSKAKCNAYKVLDKPIRPNSEINIDKEMGIYGYLADLIEPTQDDQIVKKIINSICSNTILVKDKSIGYDYLESSHHSGKIVTLNGTVLKTYTYAIESRSSEEERDYKNPIELKKRLNGIQARIKNNQDIIKKREETKATYESAINKVSKQLQSIDSLIFAYKRMTIAMNKKESLLLEKKKHMELKLSIENELSLAENEADEIKKNLPSNFDEISKFFDGFEQEFKDIDEKFQKINGVLTQKIKEQSNIEVQYDSTLKDEITSEDELTAFENEIREKDQKILDLIKDFSDGKTKIETLEREIIELKDNISHIESTIQTEKANLFQTNEEIARMDVKIETVYAEIYQKEKTLQEIKIKKEELGDNYQERSILEVENDLKILYEKLRHYYDVSEDILIRKTELEQKIVKIAEQRVHLLEEVEEARKAAESIQTEFFNRFNDKLVFIEGKINDRFDIVGIRRKSHLKLNGNLENLGVEIFINFNDAVERKISTLSGGEQTMFAITLMLTLQNLNPSPMCIFDEAQMFLDQENSHEVSRLIKSATEQGIQFVIITPDASKTILQLADSIVGISKNGKEDVSTVIVFPRIS